MEEHEPITSVIQKFLEAQFDQFEDNADSVDVEGLFIVEREFRYRLRCLEGTHTYRVNVDILRDRFGSFLDSVFRYNQELFSTLPKLYGGDVVL